ncbi:MAG TPA: ribonuclease Z, partial [Clostridia bacterium]|nr:ribonuclease Z [Clostridia bacterium]
IFGLPGLGRRGIKLTYITDTRPIDTIPSFVNESDLLVCEGTYGDDGNLQKAIENKHMTFREASELAVRGNVKEIWLTHFSPAMDEPELYFKNATDVFPNTVLGYDGITMDLKFPL